ncbi:hypothetical protein [Nonomuraea rhodomycinica]|uniref:Uncharacterized protein n=1 Tax=Nonomuraea rhodomycinica TaxID=1712872 RepID=A0A7Y6IYK3_9ACTN|nr:hypothetical protein [Nonomuraea rhodomycinica]NUW46408.1 hypothetical protein [Nonomuraea rhodomycinica]
MSPAVVAPGARPDPSWTPAGSPAEAAALARAGATVLVTLPAPLDAALAAAAVYRWHGAGVFVTEHTEQVRQALEMTDSLAGRRPPALARRALA